MSFKNNVDIDMRTLSHHVNYLLDKHGSIYQSIVSRCPDLETIFYEIDVINFGRAMPMAYLTWPNVRQSHYYSFVPRRFLNRLWCRYFTIICFTKKLEVKMLAYIQASFPMSTSLIV